MTVTARPCDPTERMPDFKDCDLRRYESDLVCNAAGMPLKTLANPGERVEDVCARCRIPEELARRPCLFMTPVKVWHGNEWKDLFACHWYHSIVREDVLRDTRQCWGCIDWFPRPPRDTNYRVAERTAAMRDTMLRRLMEPCSRAGLWACADAPRSWWRHLFGWAGRV